MTKGLNRKEDKKRKALVNTLTGFRLVMTPEDMMKSASWFDFASGVHDMEFTEKVMKEEVPKINFESY